MALLAGTTPAAAQSYPSRPIALLVPAPAGGPTDIVGRVIALTATVLVAHPSLPLRTVRDTIALAKTRPGEFNFASGGNGTLSHLTMELFTLTTGIKDFEVTTWYGLFGPAGLPRDIVAKLNSTLGAALKQPANLKRLTEQGLDASHGTPEALGNTVASELAKWARVVKAANVTVN
jgi:tripartite-type tricarboxylate transporter receptor subunit TctC